MIIKGNKHSDARGVLSYNNDFDASQVKRIYTVENASMDIIRGWQGHRIEQRWFSAIEGSFEISVIKIDDWEEPSPKLPISRYILNAETLDFLHVPAGHITAIRSLEMNSKVLVMSDYRIGEVQDEHRYDLDFFD